MDSPTDTDLTIQEQLLTVTMTIEDIDKHIAFILQRQINHKPPNTEIVDFWLDQRLELMRKEGFLDDHDHNS